MSGIAAANAAGPISEDSYNRCRAISDDKARLQCFESLTSPPAQQAPSPAPAEPQGPKNTPPGSTPDSQSGSSSTPIAGKWRLVRSSDPRAKKDIVSVMTTAELSGSDIDFAGLDLRCADSGFDVLVFLLSPLHQQARPAVTINDRSFPGTVVSPGTAIRLPREASDLAREQWSSMPKLSVLVENDAAKIHGVISLAGFGSVLQTLVETCSAR